MYRDTWIEIDLDNLLWNLSRIKERSRKTIFAVVKANAYGHGDIEIVKECELLGIDFFCVSSIDEALNLRKHGINSEILVIGYVDYNQIELVLEHAITVTITSIEWFKEVINKKLNLEKIKMHIEIDTGMNRLGIKYRDEFVEILEIAKKHNINIEGVYTHYADSSNQEVDYNETQYFRFIDILSSYEHNFKWIHSSNSDAVFVFEEDVTNAVRCGIALLGFTEVKSNLKPVLSLYSRVNQVKSIIHGETVGYSRLYRSRSQHNIAIIPVGYADGLSKRLQGFHLLVNNQYSEIIGSICMDQTMLRVSDDVKVDDIVEVIGVNLPANYLANYAGTFTYEIFTSISDRVTRKYFRLGKLIRTRNYRYNIEE